MRVRATVTVVPMLLLAGCAGVQTSLGGQGDDGRRFINLFVIFLAVTALAYLLVLIFLAIAIWRRRGETGRIGSSTMQTLLVGWIAFTGVGLAALAIASFFTDRSMARAAAKSALSVEITANQWWWDVRYRSGDPSHTLRTSNELHLPVGVPVHVTLKSNDVIHSFWVPNLTGKQDLIPGRTTDITLLPHKLGLFRAQCAEFCGVQHTHMALDVTVESRGDFLKWWQAGLQPGRPPSSPMALAGYQYVTTRECSTCHNISGTPASGSVGPDLTHLASRRSLAAGTMPMSRASLYAWIADPQSQKPGTKMPNIGLEPAELHAVVAYLQELK